MGMKEELLRNVQSDRFAQEIGAEITEVEIGFAKAIMTIQEKHCNGAGVAHGGAIFTLADYAFAAACNAEGIPTLAVNVSISYFRAVKPQDQLIATAKEISTSRKLATYLVEVHDQENHLVAQFTGTGYRKN